MEAHDEYDAWRQRQDTLIAASLRHRLYTPFGLMVLGEHLHSAPIRNPIGVINLDTPSMAQMIPTPEIGELVEQVAFSPTVYDLKVRPRVEYIDARGERQEHHPDLVVQIHASNLPHPRLLINIGPVSAMDAHAAVLAAESLGAHNVLISVDGLRTPYLDNARMLMPFNRSSQEAEDEVCRFLNDAPRDRTTVRDAVAGEVARGTQREAAEDLIKTLVAIHYVFCDLNKPYGPDSVFDPGVRPSVWGVGNPFLERLMA